MRTYTKVYLNKSDWNFYTECKNFILLKHSWAYQESTSPISSESIQNCQFQVMYVQHYKNHTITERSWSLELSNPRKKNAFALKTPRVVAWPVIYGVECIFVSLAMKLHQDYCWHLHHCIFITASINPSSIIRPKTHVKHFLTWWPWPLTYDLDLWTWPRYPSIWPTYQKAGPYVLPFGRESGNTQTDRHTHTHTHRRCQNYYTPSLTLGVKNPPHEYFIWMWFV